MFDAEISKEGNHVGRIPKKSKMQRIFFLHIGEFLETLLGLILLYTK